MGLKQGPAPPHLSNTNMKTKKYDPMCGTTISTACAEAVKIARRDRCLVKFDFNDIVLTATARTNPKTLAKKYSDECDRRHAEYIASPEYKRRQEEAEQKRREQDAIREATLADAPEHMTLRDPEGWRKACEANQDGYGGAVMTYAERWARMMEARMSNGARLADIAEECSNIADTEGITGFMYGCAVSTLAQVWAHGEALRLWHNLKTQIGTEGERANDSGGVLNPAILSVG